MLIFFAGVTENYVQQRLAQIDSSRDIVELRENSEWHEGLKILYSPGHNKTHHAIQIQFDGKILISAAAMSSLWRPVA